MIRCALLLLLLAAAATRSAQAAVVNGPDGQPIIGPNGYPLTQTPLEGACRAALDRFCPDLSSMPGQTRSEVICLRPYRSSLSFSCRRSVDAAAK